MPISNRILAVAAVCVFMVGSMAVGAGPADTSPSVKLVGTVKSADGQRLEGIIVSARQQGKTFTTSVFTDEQGKYAFPPLQPGHYRVWAQAAGFETARAEQDVSREMQQEFTLKPYKDIGRQLSGAEWIASLPEDTPENRRMKNIFRNNCAGCHQPNFILQNRFDETGWKRIIDVMETVGIYGDPPRADLPPKPFLRAFKEELAGYLAKMRGPGESPVKFKPFPRARGESAQVVITEYDVTSNSDTDQYVTQDGSDWMAGVPSAYEARGPHDAQVDANGFVWFADSQANPTRTVGRLDPKTGEIKNFKLPGKRGLAMQSHGIVIDSNGVAWFNADGGLARLDTRTEKIDRFEPPKDMDRVGGTLDVDLHGTVWASVEGGAIRFDPKTNEFTEFRSVTPGRDGRTYGIAVDAQGNCWWAEMNYDKLGKSDIKTGKSLEFALEKRPGWDENILPSDREIYNSAPADWNSAPPWAQGPRRLGADKRGNLVWVADWWADNLAKIDIRTNKVLAYYKYPGPGYAGVYATVIDKRGNVWMNLSNADRVAKFDPKTEKWTTYQLPSLGTETRFIAIDERNNGIEIWTPYWRTNRIARLQFRTKEQLQAQR